MSNHKEKLLEIYESCISSNKVSLGKDIIEELNVIKGIIERQRGIYVVLITLGIHKIIDPKQDIRIHQSKLPGGFSGRSLDTKYISPTLTELKLPSMSESGWLTRSLEQPYPYDSNYNGKIGNGNLIVKSSFLKIVDFIQNNPQKCEEVIRYLLYCGIEIRNKNKVEITKITDPEKISIDSIISTLNEYFQTNYHTSGGSKLPVISFYSIYSILINEMKRFENSTLGSLGSHTSSDRTSKSSGDIEVFLDGQVLESLEIKFDIDIDVNIVNRVIEKIYKFNPKRYYVLSTHTIKESDYDEIISKVHQLKMEHGCQLIINGLLPTLKYYLRLINNLEEFLVVFTNNIYQDKELKIIHKDKWKEMVEKTFN
jgi:DNA (cytosine-5)-methyltransferase 1